MTREEINKSAQKLYVLIKTYKTLLSVDQELAKQILPMIETETTKLMWATMKPL